jgi:rare lipoprotein A
MSKRPASRATTICDWPSKLEATVKQISAKPALLAATVFALSYAECGGGTETAHPKLGRPANPATAVGMGQRITQGAASGDVGSPKTYKRSSMVTKSSRGPLPMEQKRKTSSQSWQAAHGKSDGRLASGEKLSKRQIAMFGFASFYSEDSDTASGERFDTHKLNAAHPSLPFGTRLRVTNVVNGKSVTVRVNDRGPFVHGRIIDVTSAAAEALGMVNVGVVKVTLDIVRQRSGKNVVSVPNEGRPHRKSTTPSAIALAQRMPANAPMHGHSAWKFLAGPPSPPPPSPKYSRRARLVGGEMPPVRNEGQHSVRRDPPLTQEPDLEARGVAQVPIMPQSQIRSASSHDQANPGARDYPLRLGFGRKRTAKPSG